MNTYETAGMDMACFERILKMTQGELKEYLRSSCASTAMSLSVKTDFSMRKVLYRCCWLPIWILFIPISRISSAVLRMAAI